MLQLKTRNSNHMLVNIKVINSGLLKTANTMAEPPSSSMHLMQPNITGSESPSEQSTSRGAGGYPAFSGGMGGYDYEFVSPPDERYKCAICLMVLRDPCQTPCGHLYCKTCILKWLRGPHSRCPADNEEISEASLFLDKFSKREIDNFKAFCPNSKQGCDVIATIKQMTDHLQECPLALLPCPNKCSHVLRRKDLEEHVSTTCGRRLVVCPDCNLSYPAIDLETHKSVCPRVRIPCRHCNDEVTREEISYHEDRLCPRKIICCTFFHLGCAQQMRRGELQNHLRDSLTHHLNLLCIGITVIFRHLGLLSLSPSGLSAPVTEVMQAEVMEAMAAVLPSLQQQASFNVRGNTSSTTSSSATSHPSPTSSLPLSHPQPHPHPLLRFPDPSSNHRPSLPPPPIPAATTPSGTDEAQEASVVSYRSHPAEGDNADFSPASLAGRWGDSATSSSTGGASSSAPQKTSLPGGGRSSSSSSGGSVSGGSVSGGSVSWQGAEQKLVLHTQQLVEMQGKVETVERVLKEKLKHYEQHLNELQGRICQGVFFWKINHYSRYQQEAERGETTALHSQPFYSRPMGGYKLCLRANLNGVDSARGRHLSLFVHFMQGEYDDILEWPFSGRIVLSVMDQNDCCERRQHVQETLVAQPHLAAFQKPSTPRNHKGFGYMEFLPLSGLQKSSFVKHDTLIVKVHVLPHC